MTLPKRTTSCTAGSLTVSIRFVPLADISHVPSPPPASDGKYYRIYSRRHCAPFPRPAPSCPQSDHVRPLYVKYLEDHIDEFLLECMFAPFGTVTGTKIFLDRYGYSKGFGFVWFANDGEAADARYWMDGRPIEGTELYVAPAEYWEDRQARLAEESGQYDDDYYDDDDYYEEDDYYDDDDDSMDQAYYDDRNYHGNNQPIQQAPSVVNAYYNYEGNHANYQPPPVPKQLEPVPMPVRQQHTTVTPGVIVTEPRGPPPAATPCSCGTPDTPAQKLKFAPAGCAAA